MAKKITSAEFFDKNNAAFMKFGRMFTRKLTDQELINALTYSEGRNGLSSSVNFRSRRSSASLSR